MVNQEGGNNTECLIEEIIKDVKEILEEYLQSGELEKADAVIKVLYSIDEKLGKGERYGYL